jgi:hypothetical protein
MTYADSELGFNGEHRDPVTGTWLYDPCTEMPLETPAQRAARHALNKPLIEAFNNLRKEPIVSITPGELRGRTQPTILLRMTSSVAPAPGNEDGSTQVFRAGLVVFAQYIGNGRLLLTPIDPMPGYPAQVVMASALNSTAEIIGSEELADAFGTTMRPAADHVHEFGPVSGS